MITPNFTLGVRIACDGGKILAYGIVYNLQQSVTEFLYRVQLGGVFSYIFIVMYIEKTVIRSFIASTCF